MAEPEGRVDLDTAIDAFLQHARLERGLAQNTLEAYSRDLARFSDFLQSLGLSEIGALDRKHVTRFLSSLVEAGLAPSSRARALVSIRRMLSYAAAEKLTDREPLEGVLSPRQEASLPRTLHSEEVLQLLEACDRSSSLGLRDYAMVELLYAAGLRVSELVGLPLAGLDLRAGLVRVVGKGDVERVVPVGQASLDALQRYLERGRPALLGQRDDATHGLFLSRLGRPMTRQNFFALLRKLALRAGIPSERVSPHVLRHAFATDLLSGGADLRSIQAMLGHADLSTTQVYTHVSRGALRDTVEQRHPRGSGRRPRR